MQKNTGNPKKYMYLPLVSTGHKVSKYLPIHTQYIFKSKRKKKQGIEKLKKCGSLNT
jgi:hypothetical protein